MHPDGYVELRDRLKDVIISGGENIATIEVEQALAAHPSVSEVAVVAAPDERWGEVPVAFVTAAGGETPEQEELQEFARGRLARFKVPKRIEVVDELPKTGTGKIQKFVLRERGRLVCGRLRPPPSSEPRSISTARPTRIHSKPLDLEARARVVHPRVGEHRPRQQEEPEHRHEPAVVGALEHVAEQPGRDDGEARRDQREQENEAAHRGTSSLRTVSRL